MGTFAVVGSAREATIVIMAMFAITVMLANIAMFAITVMLANISMFAIIVMLANVAMFAIIAIFAIITIFANIAMFVTMAMPTRLPTPAMFETLATLAAINSIWSHGNTCNFCNGRKQNHCDYCKDGNHNYTVYCCYHNYWQLYISQENQCHFMSTLVENTLVFED